MIADSSTRSPKTTNKADEGIYLLFMIINLLAICDY